MLAELLEAHRQTCPVLTQTTKVLFISLLPLKATSRILEIKAAMYQRAADASFQ